MKALLQLLGNLAFAVSTVVGVFVVAANASGPEQEPHRFQGLYTAGLWTSEPTRVDPTKQKLERIAVPVVAVAAANPELETAHATNAVNSREVASLDPSAGLARLQQADLTGQPVPASNAVDTAMQAAHVTWCLRHYRSYDMADNSYRSFSGQRRSCVSPYLSETGQAPLPVARTADAAGAAMIPDEASMSDHARSCMQRYRSYRVADNTYQPFDGGPRRACM